MSRFLLDVLLIFVGLKSATDLWRAQVLPDNGLAFFIVAGLAVFVGLRSPIINESVRIGVAITSLTMWWAALVVTTPNMVVPMTLIAAGMVAIYLLTPVLKFGFLLVGAALVGLAATYFTGALPQLVTR